MNYRFMQNEEKKTKKQKTQENLQCQKLCYSWQLAWYSTEICCFVFMR